MGHWYRPPKPEDVVVVRMEGPAILKLNAGTWHAGPLFTQPVMDFFNLELADTNVRLFPLVSTVHLMSKDAEEVACVSAVPHGPIDKPVPHFAVAGVKD